MTFLFDPTLNNPDILAEAYQNVLANDSSLALLADHPDSDGVIFTLTNDDLNDALRAIHAVRQLNANNTNPDGFCTIDDAADLDDCCGDDLPLRIALELIYTNDRLFELTSITLSN